MKKVLSFLLVLCMVVGLCATMCFANPAEGGDSAAGEQAAGSEGGAGGAQDPGAGGAGGGDGKGGSSKSVAALTADEVKIIDVEIENIPANRTLDGLYTGEDAGESLGDKTVKAGETWFVEDNCVVDALEIEDGATVEADFPVIVFFTESSTVENGEIIGNVQFVNDYDEVVAIIHTNDTHGFIETEPYVAGLKNQLIDSGNYSLVLSVNAGDQYAGGFAVAHVYEGEFIPYVMNSAKYDFMTWGNNDAGLTDKGIETYLLAAIGDATGVKTLLANQRASEDIDMVAYTDSYESAVGADVLVEMYPEALSLNEDGTVDFSGINPESYNAAAGDNVLADGAIVETALGTKIGLIGESTQGGSMTDAYFSGGMSTISSAQTVTDVLLEQGAQAVVLVGHIGWFDEESTETSSNDTNSALVAKNTTGIDAIIDGHTHSVINNGEGSLFAGYGNNPIVNQASCKGGAVGVLYLYFKDGQVIAKDSENFVPEEDGSLAGVEADADAQAAVDKALGRLAEDGYTTVWATTPYFLNAERTAAEDVGGGVRANETNLGDLVADAILYTAKKLWTENEISIALYPGYWVRSSIAEGDITLVDALSVFANSLKIYYAEYTAAELVSKMNTSCAKIGEENNNMFQVSGLTCKYDPETKEVVYLAVGDEVIYENGEYLVGDDWTVGCAAEAGGGDIDNAPAETTFVNSNREMAQYFCEFLAEAEYEILPDDVCPGARVIPAE